MAAKKAARARIPGKAAAKPTARGKRAGDQLHKPAQPAGLQEVALLSAEGCSAQEITEKLGTPIRTVYSWLARVDVQEQIAAFVEGRRRTQGRVYQRHLETTRRQFEDWMAGKLELTDEAQKLAMLEYGRHLLGMGGSVTHTVAPEGDTKALPAGGGAAPLMPAGGTVVVQVYGDTKREEVIETTAKRVE
jgi:DNA-binding transcriptional ArsR family regulator